MSAISDLEEVLERCVNEEKTGRHVLSVIVDFLVDDAFWTVNQIGPETRKRFIALAEKMKEVQGNQVVIKNQTPNGWLRAVDEALVVTHLGVADAEDSYETAKRKLNELICWHVAVALDPAVSEGAVELQNKAYRKAASLCLEKDYGFDIGDLIQTTRREVMTMMARRLGEEIQKLIVP